MPALSPTFDEDMIAQQFRDEAAALARTSLRRGLNYLVTFISNAIGIGTAGTGYLLSGVLSLVSLIDINLMMIWGYYLSGKKSVLFPPLDWSPLPLKHILPDIWLHIGVIILDLMMVLLIGLAISLIAFLIHLTTMSKLELAENVLFDAQFREFFVFFF